MRQLKPKRSSGIFAWGALLLGLGVLCGVAAQRGWVPDAAGVLDWARVLFPGLGTVLMLVGIARVLRNLDDIAVYFFNQQQAARQRQPPVQTSELPKVRAARKPVK